LCDVRFYPAVLPTPSIEKLAVPTDANAITKVRRL
jgi:hypothetical protein